MPNYQRTAYYLDVDAVRELVQNEIAIRGVNYVEIQEQTGVLAVGLGRFLNPRQNVSLHHDGLITMIKWAGGEVNRFVKRRRTVARHTDTFEQRQLRKGQAFVQNLGVQPEQSESSVDVLMRLVAEAKEKGFLA
jgi:hypothetical protein